MKVGLIASPSRPRSPSVEARTVANVWAAPSCQTLIVPDRSAQKSRPSGAKARAVAKLAAIAWLGGRCPWTAQGPLLACALGEGVERTVGVERVAIVEELQADTAVQSPTLHSTNTLRQRRYFGPLRPQAIADTIRD